MRRKGTIGGAFSFAYKSVLFYGLADILETKKIKVYYIWRGFL